MARYLSSPLVLGIGTLTLIFGCSKPAPPQSVVAPPPEAKASTPPADSTTARTQEPATTMSVKPQSFGKTSDGQETTLFTCTNKNGLVLKLTDYGAAIVALHAPGRDGKLVNINLGFDSAAGYENHTAYFGCTVGRYANRIAKGKFTLDGKDYTLATNNGPNHLHGGVKGFNRMIWKAEPHESAEAVGVTFTYRSPDGEEGYPGTLDVKALYTLNNNNELTIDFSAQTDTATVLNLANHAYWNLGGVASGKILNHELLLAADKYIAVDESLIPTGLADVDRTPMDFRKPRKIGSRMGDLPPMGDTPNGYDHCYVLAGSADKPMLAARVREPESGRVMEVYTTQPGVQLYTGNFLDGDAKNGGHEQHTAFCLETQHFPDSPNRPEYPTTVLRPGEKFHQVTVHKFLVE